MNIHAAKELAYRLIRHARSELGYTPVVRLEPQDADLLNTLLSYATARQELGLVCEDCRTVVGSKGDLTMKSDHHGGVKVVCVDRDACHRRSPG